MYFLWKRTPHGSIRVSSGGLSGFINRVLSEKSRCCGLSLAEGENASVTLVLSSDSPVSDTLGIEERIAAVVASLGLRSQVVWVDKSVPVEWSDALLPLRLNPWAWMLLAGVVALGCIAGLKGIFWTFFWGTAGWFAAKFALSFWAKRGKMGFILPEAWR